MVSGTVRIEPRTIETKAIENTALCDLKTTIDSATDLRIRNLGQSDKHDRQRRFLTG